MRHVIGSPHGKLSENPVFPAFPHLLLLKIICTTPQFLIYYWVRIPIATEEYDAGIVVSELRQFSPDRSQRLRNIANYKNKGGNAVKLILAIIQLDDFASVVRHLAKSGFFSTKLTSVGGFLKEGNVTIMVGVEVERFDEALEIINKYSHSRTKLVPTPSLEGMDSLLAETEVTVGGATVFVLDCEQFLRF